MLKWHSHGKVERAAIPSLHLYMPPPPRLPRLSWEGSNALTTRMCMPPPGRPPQPPPLLQYSLAWSQNMAADVILWGMATSLVAAATLIQWGGKTGGAAGFCCWICISMNEVLGPLLRVQVLYEPELQLLYGFNDWLINCCDKNSDDCFSSIKFTWITNEMFRKTMSSAVHWRYFFIR